MSRAVDSLGEALRHYAWLCEANTTGRVGRTPEAWDAAAARLEAGAEGLTGDERRFVEARARDARANAAILRLPPRAPLALLAVAVAVLALISCVDDRIATRFDFSPAPAPVVEPPPPPPIVEPPPQVQRFSGRAIDYFAGTAVPGAAVVVEPSGPHLIAASGPDGRFAIAAVPVGAWRVVASSSSGHRSTSNAVTVADAAVEQDVYLVTLRDEARQYVTAGIERTIAHAFVVADLRRADGSPLAGLPLAQVRLLDGTGAPVPAVGPLVIGSSGDVVPSGPTSTEVHGGRSRIAYLNVPPGTYSLAVGGSAGPRTLAVNGGVTVLAWRGVPCAPTIDAITVGASSYLTIGNPCGFTHRTGPGWSLVWLDAAGADPRTVPLNAWDLPSGGEHIYLCPPWLSGGVALRDGSGAILDRVGYGTLAAGHPYVEGSAAPALTWGGRLVRAGPDTDDNAADFVVGSAP